MQDQIKTQLNRRSAIKAGVFLFSLFSDTLNKINTISDNRSILYQNFQYNPQNTGTVVNANGLVTNVSQTHQIDLSYPIWLPPVVDESTVYISSTAVDRKVGGITAVEKIEQTQQWDSDQPPNIFSTPSVEKEHLYVTTPDSLVALDRTDGSKQWTVNLPASNFSSPTVSNGILYLGTRNGSVVAIDRSGNLKWESSVDSGSIVSTTPAVGGEKVFVGTESGGMYALDLEDGSQVWNRVLSSPVRAAPTYTEDDVTIVTTDGTLAAIDPTNGDEHWRKSCDVSTASSPAVADKRIYWTVENTLYALSKADGSELWRFETGGFTGLNNLAPSPIRVGDVVYVTTGDKFVYAVDAKTGTERWRFRPDSGNVLSVTVVGDTAYVGTDTGTLHVLTGDTNIRPELDIQYFPREPSVGEQVTFDASNSHDRDGTVTSYDWDVDGDGEFEASGQQVSQKFTSSGTVEVTVQISDNDDETVTRQTLVTVTEDSTVTGTQPSVESGIQLPLDRIPGGIIGVGAAGSSVALGLLYGLSRAMGGKSGIEDEKTSTESATSAAATPSSTRSSSSEIEFPESSFVEYNQGELIGTGPITRTVEASIDEYDDTLALRSLDVSDSSTLDQSLLKQFFEGLQTWQTISNHENILTVLDLGDKPVPWAALEIAGSKFEPTEYVDTSTEQTLSLISQLCDAVHHGHRHGLAHGALSPSNVLLVNDEPSLQVADWKVTGRALGIVPPRDDAYGLSKDLVELGVTQSADIYAIGAVAYALFTGERVPTDPVDRKERIELVGGISADLKSVLLTATATVDQYDTVLHLRDAIKRSV
ncbi:outer membrane protein assembly factor BamB family protein [Halorubrum ezzemoulense]|uniref:outer membrane protein assembly factor BamB family protein n=1 Tax=Halorubrum ezzemoulense TaxID=337243 RepID=UPI00232AF4BF|nr:PQQ-binding-like beta-propeller repeat protein [Halorubrum ezzemoulense]MDB2242728.1 PQQ-binding-like beta-propeller repeat protein [Halorubrum ezzemoulense]